MRIFWHANAPFVGSGYGMQTATFVPRIRDLGHDVGLSATWGVGGALTEWQGMKLYPADDAWGNDKLLAYATHFADGEIEEVLVVTLADVWPLDTAKMPPRLACWVPVDHEPIPPAVTGFFARSKARPIAMSRFGQAELERAGFDALYVPHGIDTDVFFPRTPERREQVRRDAGLPESAFVVGMVAANKGNAPPRKAFPQVFQAFARLREKHSDAMLYVHADAFSKHGINLRSLAMACEIPLKAIRWSDPLNLDLGVAPDQVADLMSCFDVLANPSLGEGFGIPIVEAQACGTPVVVTDWTAMRELCGAGWKVGGDRHWDAPQESWFRTPSVDDLSDAFEEAYDRASGMREQAADFGRLYDADLVTEEFWKPALAALESRTLDEVPALAPREAVAA